MIDIAKNVVKNLPTEQNSGKSIENFYKTSLKGHAPIILDLGDHYTGYVTFNFDAIAKYLLKIRKEVLSYGNGKGL